MSSPEDSSGTGEACNVPGRAIAEDGMVILDGPQAVAVTLTPDAAFATAESLKDAAKRAAEQMRDAPPGGGIDPGQDEDDRVRGVNPSGSEGER